MRSILMAAFAVSLAFTGTAAADNSAYFSARYGGWSKEPACERVTGNRMCLSLTVGRDPHRRELAHLLYMCSPDAEAGFQQALVMRFWTRARVDSNDPTLKVRWDSEPESMIETVGSVDRAWQGKPRYAFYILDAKGFLSNARAHDRLSMVLPVREYHGRETKVTFSMENAIDSMMDAAKLCGKQTAFLLIGTLASAP